MSETKTPDGKTLSVGKSTLSLKPRTETGVVRQSFSHGRSKQVVVEVKKRRIPRRRGQARGRGACSRSPGGSGRQARRRAPLAAAKRRRSRPPRQRRRRRLPVSCSAP